MGDRHTRGVVRCAFPRTAACCRAAGWGADAAPTMRSGAAQRALLLRRGPTTRIADALRCSTVHRQLFTGLQEAQMGVMYAAIISCERSPPGESLVLLC